MNRRITWVLLTSVLFAARAGAHEVRPAYLELRQTSAETFDVIWKVPARGDLRLGIYAQLPPDCESTTERAGMFADGAYIERWSVRHPGALVGEAIEIVGLQTTLTDVLVRITRMDGATQVERLTPSSPSMIVARTPSVWNVAWTYLALGVEHILLGVDHLLFVLALLLLIQGWKRILGTVTAFTVAHSVTLALATLGVVHVPAAPVEAIIALSIVFVASEIVRGVNGRPGVAQRSPWIVAFTFGLLHGLGFAGALRDIGLPPNAIPLALFQFNIGVELGQLMFIAAVILIWSALRRLPLTPSNRWRLAPAYLIGAVAMYWVLERIARFPTLGGV